MKNRLYNFDALRFIAAWIVVLCHVEIWKPHFGFHRYSAYFFSNSAQLAVTFFFVLSGFLITWLLLIDKSKDKTEKIDVWRFYRKRILRIWPLYYLLIILGFFILRQMPFFSAEDPTNYFSGTKHNTGLLYYIFFLPNYAQYKFGSPMLVGQVWSLGVEEFFYLFFPLAVYFIPLRKMPSFLIMIAIISGIFSAIMRILQPQLYGKIEVLAYIYSDKYRLYSFALGGLAAYYFLKENSMAWLKQYLRKKYISYGLLFMTLVFIIIGRTFSHITQQAYSLLFAVLLLSLLLSGIRPWILNNRAVVYFGRISYGIYMLHIIAIIVAFKIIHPLFNTGIEWLDSVIVYASSTILSIVLAIISWEFFEKLFLKFRTRKERRMS